MLKKFEISKDTEAKNKPSKKKDEPVYPEFYDSLFYQYISESKVPETHFICDIESARDRKTAKNYPGELTSYFICDSEITREVCACISNYTGKIILVFDELNTRVINITCLFLSERIPVWYYKKMNGKNVDAIEYISHEWAGNENQEDRIRYISTITEIVSFCSDKIRREEYIKTVCRKFKIKASDMKLEINRLVNDRDDSITFLDETESKLPKHVDRDEFLKCGFYEEYEPGKAGYYFHVSQDKFIKASNFVVNPLFHIYSKTENKRMVEINNGYEKKIVELPSQSLVSLEKFKVSMFDEGYFVFEGQNSHLLKIISKIGNKFPLCYELKTLGWQSEGFFAYSNCIYNGKLVEMDVYGIVEHEGINYYSPSSSAILKDVRREDDEYENDRYLLFNKPKIVFSEWCSMLERAYGSEKASIAIGFIIVTIFRDIIYKLDNTCPNLYAYGPPQSGKSALADSISNLFFKDMKPFNLNQGTDFAFFSRLNRFRNCPTVFNEFDEDAIREEWFRALKAVYDGEGRERGRGGSKNKTEIQKINCTVVLCGQILSTKDDGSVLSRCVILPFEAVNDRSNEQARAFRELKNIEKEGLGGLLVELLSHRDEFKEQYPDIFDSNLKLMKEKIKQDGNEFKERIVRNYSAVYTAFELMASKFSLSIRPQWFFNHCKNEVVRLSDLLNNSNALADFWNTLLYLIDKGDLKQGIHYKVEMRTDVTIKSKSNNETKYFDNPTKLIYLRLNIIHKMYAEASRRTSGKNGLNLQTLEFYIRANKGYVGNNPGSSFKDEKSGKHCSTSSHVFKYDELNVDLERFDEGEEVKMVTKIGSISVEPKIVDYGYGPKLEFQIFNDESYQDEGGNTVIKSDYIRIISTNTALISGINAGDKVSVAGEMVIKEGREKIHKTIYATSIDKVQSDIVINPDLPF